MIKMGQYDNKHWENRRAMQVRQLFKEAGILFEWDE